MTINGSRLFLSTFLLLTMAVFAFGSGPGSFDLSFAGTGHKLENFGSGSDVARDVAVQADGKIVAVGRTSMTGGSFNIAVARFNADGTLDNSFSEDGKLTVPASTPAESPGAAVAVQADGKIVIAGWINVGGSDEFLVMRFNSDGTPDTSFDGDGQVITPFQGTDRGGDVLIQPDGRILIAGSAGGGTAMIRYNADGSFDTAFGGNDNGMMFITAFITMPGFMNAIVMQPDGKIVLAGIQELMFRNLGIARYNADGTPDTAFGTNGIITTPIFNSDGGPGTVALTPDGKIAAAGFFRNGSQYEFALVRYNANGTPDTGFSGDGMSSAPVSGTLMSLGHTLAVQPDGAIIAAGYVTPTGGVGNADFAFMRVTADGTLDNTFDGDGKLVTQVSSTTHDIVNSLALQPDGKIIAAGWVRQFGGDDFALVRYAADGSLDPSFGGGIIMADIGEGLAYGRDAVVQPDEKILALAEAYGGYSLVRYNANSTLDTQFGTSGKVVTPFNSSAAAPRKILLQPDGKIVVAGTTGATNDQRTTIVRYNANGTLDTTFDGDGKLIVESIPGSFANTGVSAALGNDGKIVVIAYGVTAPVVPQIFTVMRFNQNGSPDASFDNDGMLIPAQNVRGNSVQVQPDGAILVAGGYDPLDDGPARTVFCMARYKTDGSTDTSFGGTGVVITPVLTGGSTTFTSMALSLDGRITAVGRSTTGSDFDLALVRYNSNGSLDNTFDNDGMVTTPLVVSRDSANKVAIQSDGKIVATADSRVSGTNNMALVRYNTDGSLDMTYGASGVARFPLGYSVISHGLTLDASDNAIVVAGTLTQLLIARITSSYAALVDVGGRIIAANGQGIGGATVVLTDVAGNSQTARTSAFGYYGFFGVSSNEIYTVRVSNKRYRFNPSTQTITVTGSLSNVDFIGNPGSESKVVVKGTKINDPETLDDRHAPEQKPPTVKITRVNLPGDERPGDEETTDRKRLR